MPPRVFLHRNAAVPRAAPPQSRAPKTANGRARYERRAHSAAYEAKRASVASEFRQIPTHPAEKAVSKRRRPDPRMRSPLDGRSASEHRIGFVPWCKRAFCAFAVDAPKPPYGAIALEKSLRAAEKIANPNTAAFEVPENPVEAPHPRSFGAGRLREESRLSIRRRPSAFIRGGKSAPPSARAAVRPAPRPPPLEKAAGRIFARASQKYGFRNKPWGILLKKESPHGKIRRPLSGPIFSQQNSSNRE